MLSRFGSRTAAAASNDYYPVEDTSARVITSPVTRQGAAAASTLASTLPSFLVFPIVIRGKLDADGNVFPIPTVHDQ